MILRRTYILKATLLGALYGLLLGGMTGFLFPIGLGLGALLGALIGYGQSFALQQATESLERPQRLRMSGENQFRVPLHRQQVRSLHRLDDPVRGERRRP